jgi:hypothetical protein
MQTAETDGQMHRLRLTETYKNPQIFFLSGAKNFVEGECNGANDAVMIHTSQQSVRKQKAKTFPSTDEPDIKTSCTGQ